jgi:hypothetical protein
VSVKGTVTGRPAARAPVNTGDAAASAPITTASRVVRERRWQCPTANHRRLAAR